MQEMFDQTMHLCGRDTTLFQPARVQDVREQRRPIAWYLQVLLGTAMHLVRWLSPVGEDVEPRPRRRPVGKLGPRLQRSCFKGSSLKEVFLSFCLLLLCSSCSSPPPPPVPFLDSIFGIPLSLSSSSSFPPPLFFFYLSPPLSPANPFFPYITKSY